MKKVLLGIVIGAFAFHAWQKLSHPEPDVVASPVPVNTDDVPVERTDSTPAFRCDGRVYCSEMTSCDEAMFFLRNCPGVKMDGEGDGIPCEKQWCGHQ